MTQVGSVGFSEDQKAETWWRWRAGESLSDIGRAIRKRPTSVFGVLKRHGGITPRQRQRSQVSLSLEEREDISRGIAAGLPMREIASRLGRAPSTISREIMRHGGRTNYRATQADRQAWDWARRPKLCCLARHSELRQIVTRKLALNWSPEQISGWL